jgi:hypothetical protein
VALATWLNEAIPTVMPEASRFFIAAPEVESESRPTDQTAQLVVPLLRIERDAQALPAVWVFEDSQSDLGVIRALSDDLRYLLDLCFDWLRWRFDDSRDPEAGGVCLVNSQALGRDWFAFGCKAIDPAFGLEDLKNTLARYQELFRWFTPRQRTARGASLLGDAASAESTACDICAAAITAGAPCDVLVDGRVSCRACTAVGVTSAAEIERLFREVAQPFYREALGEVEVANVRVELVDQNDISLAQGKSFLPTSGFDMRAIGLAIPGGSHARSGTREEGGRHLVQVESGFSPEATACTLVHELCHVWQFNYLNTEQLYAAHGVALTEGHAVWTEEAFIEWLRVRQHPLFSSERIHRAACEIDLLKQSTGTYGQGYRELRHLIAHQYQSPFTILRRSYPRDGTTKQI